MSRKFEQLDAEQHALHQSWDDVGRVVLLVSLTAAVVWAPCALLRKTVHIFGDRLLEGAGSPGWLPSVSLLGLLALGGLFRGLLHRYEAWRDVERDGIDVALRNYALSADDDPQARLRRPAFALMARKAVASFVTLATGGSGGLEGPVVLIGESAGAGVARVMAARSAHELRTYQVAGIAAAVATLLNAPFAASLFALEIVYADRIIYRKLAYCLLAATVAYVLNTQAFGAAQPLFIAPDRVVGEYAFSEYLVSAIVAIAISTPVALGFGQAMKHTRLMARRVNPVLRGVVGGLGTGLVALSLAWTVDVDVRHVLGMGDWTLRQLLGHGPGDVQAVWLLLLIIVAKMLATAFTIQSGGSVGLLIPSMMLGGVAGAATGRTLHLLGLYDGGDVSVFIVVGVASALVGMVGVPMAAIALTLEVFGPQYGPPTILACGLTYVLTLRLTVYERQLARGRDVEREQSDRVLKAATSSSSTIPVVVLPSVKPAPSSQPVVSTPPPKSPPTPPHKSKAKKRR